MAMFVVEKKYEGRIAMNIFVTRPFWLSMNVPMGRIKNKFGHFFGKRNIKIDDIDEAIDLLKDVIYSIQKELIAEVKKSPLEMLFKLHYIFGEVHYLYLFEKEQRSKLQRFEADDIFDIFIENRNIMRDIIDACNIWIENCILFQKNSEDIKRAKAKGYRKDTNLLINLYLYGFASRSLSLISLSKKFDKKLSFYGLKITPNENMPAEVLKYHPVIFFGDAVTGNQNVLSDTNELKRADVSPFGEGFFNEYGVEFLLFLAAIYSIQKYELRGDEKSLTIISKQDFIELIESCTNPTINGECFYSNFVLSKNKVKSQLTPEDDCVWKMGCNKYRYELRPFIDLGNSYVFISYAALEQAKYLWHNYCCNGGSGYTNQKDKFTASMELRNKELSELLVDKIISVLNDVYTPTFCEKDVPYDKIFGQREENYGDYDIIYYTAETNELFLIESKYFSDSLNSSGIVNDYNKMYRKGGYYSHCKKRYDIFLSEPELMKKYIGVNSEIIVHLLFISSKPLEIELQETDEVVTCLPLSIFRKYIDGQLISEDGKEIVRPTVIL